MAASDRNSYRGQIFVNTGDRLVGSTKCGEFPCRLT
jgi:hypothetical protein